MSIKGLVVVVVATVGSGCVGLIVSRPEQELALVTYECNKDAKLLEQVDANSRPSSLSPADKAAAAYARNRIAFDLCMNAQDYHLNQLDAGY